MPSHPARGMRILARRRHGARLRRAEFIRLLCLESAAPAFCRCRACPGTLLMFVAHGRKASRDKPGFYNGDGKKQPNGFGSTARGYSLASASFRRIADPRKVWAKSKPGKPGFCRSRGNALVESSLLDCSSIGEPSKIKNSRAGSALPGAMRDYSFRSSTTRTSPGESSSRVRLKPSDSASCSMAWLLSSTSPYSRSSFLPRDHLTSFCISLRPRP